MKTGQTILLAAFFLILTQTSCQKHSTRSVVIVSVDSLSINDISCSQKPGTKSGFAILCDESIRFTHAYTPSVLSVPALASLMTGLYPFQHGVRHNGTPGLGASVVTFAEAGAKSGFRTAFFSGGAPVLKKTGLNQGFEVFDDNIVPNQHLLFKPFKKNIEAFEKWLQQDVKDEAFIAHFYVPDLSYLEVKTITPAGEARSQSFESQLEELDLQLRALIQILIKRNLWRDTVFIFNGLQGRNTIPRFDEIPPINLHVENTQVPLFIKPFQKVRDSALNWTVDRNISLVDVGQTVFDLIGAPLPIAKFQFPVFSLKNTLSKIESQPPENRTLLLESGWAAWKKMGPVRGATLNNYDYLLYDQKLKYYNILTDRFELNPLPPTRVGDQSSEEMTKKLSDIGFEKFSFNKELNSHKYSIPYLTWTDSSQSTVLHEKLKAAQLDDSADAELSDWIAASALELKDWQKSFRPEGASKNPLWLYEKKIGPCWSLLARDWIDSDEMKKCPDALFRDLLSWQKDEQKESIKESLKAKFHKLYLNSIVDRKILKTNMAMGQIWDLSPELSWKPTYIDVYFALPENQNFKNSILKSLPLASDSD